MITIIYQIAFLFFLCFILIKSADQVVVAVHRLSTNSTSVAFLISALFLAIATSLPELFVGITSGLSNISSLSFGNVAGANIANITLVGGVAAFLAGKVKINPALVSREIMIAGIAGVLPFILIFIDNGLNRVDGLILILCYVAYSLSFFKDRFAHIVSSLKEPGFFYKFFRKLNHIDADKSKETLRLIAGVIVLLFSSNILVSLAKNLAGEIGVPVFLIGLVILSVGTTLPELVFSIRSLKDGEATIFLGNLLGSIIINSTLIIGIAAFLSPIETFPVKDYLYAFVTFILIFSIFWMFLKSKLSLSRKEGFVLILIYITFVVLEFIL